MKWTFQNRLLPGFIIAILFFASISFYSYRTLNHFSESAHWVDHTYQVLLGVEHIFSSTKDLERMARSYALTGDKVYLEDYHESLTLLQLRVQEIRELTRDNSNQQQNFEILEPIISKRITFSKKLIELYETKQFSLLTHSVLLGESKKSMSELNSLIAKMVSDERKLLEERIQAEYSASQKAKKLIIFGSGLAFLVMMMSLFYLYRSLARERKNEEKHAHLARLVEFSEDAIIGKDLDGIIQSWNNGAEKLYEYSAEEAVGKSITLIIPHESQDEFKQILYNIQQGRSVNFETTRLTKRGKKVFVSLGVSPIYGASGEIIGAVSTARNITELKQITLERDQFFNLSLDLLCIADLDGSFKRVNPAFHKLLGYSAEEMLSKPYYEFIHPEDIQKTREEIEKLSHGINTINFENRFRHKDGTYRWLSWSTPAPKAGESALYAVGRDITDRKKIDQMKNEFISVVSHELRTPLTSIRGSLGLIVGKIGSDLNPQMKSLVDIALNNCERLGRLINDILDIEKIESGSIEFKMKPELLKPLLEQSLEVNKSYGNQYQVQFRLEDLAPDARVNVDTDKLLQVMSNFLSNAAKFSPSNSEVLVKVSRENTLIRVEVIDQGAGIPTEFQTHIFEKFAQADSSDTRKKGGTGLGLNITKAIVERMRGKVGFQTSKKGTTFYFDLPEWHVAPTHLEEVAENESKILICEDDPDVARLLQIMLEEYGYQADIAYTASQAIEMVQKRDYDGMTLDIMLPDEDGVAVIHKLRALSKTKALPIVVVSVKAEATHQELKGTGLNVIDWINKPIDPSRLQEAIRKISQLKQFSIPRLLHVEDDVDTTHWVRALLQNHALVSSAHSFEQAEEKIKKEVFDLVLLDILLPDGNGAELIPLIKKRYGEAVPVIVLSSNEWGEKVRQRVAATLVKSLTTHNDLLIVIQNVLKAVGGLPPIVSARSQETHFLICEDDADTAQLLKIILEEAGYGADIAYSGEQAFDLLEKYEYSAMTLDLMLPDQSGISILRRLREKSKTQNLPVIVVSVLAREAKQDAQISALQVVDWLEKPINDARLFQMVKEMMKKKGKKRPAILHVEDSEDIAKIVSLNLEEFAEVTSAYSLKEARDELAHKHFDLVLLDIQLPDGNGLDLLINLNTHPEGPIPVVIFSSQELSRADHEKVAAVLSKREASSKDILKTIESILKR